MAPVSHHVIYRGEGQIGADSGCAVSEQQGDMVDLTDIAALNEEADSGPGLLAD